MGEINISKLCGCRAVASALDALYNCIWLPMFRRILLPPSSRYQVVTADSQGSLSAGENCPLPPPYGDLASMRQLDKLYIVIKELVSVINFIEARLLRDKILRQICSDTGSDYKHEGGER